MTSHITISSEFEASIEGAVREDRLMEASELRAAVLRRRPDLIHVGRPFTARLVSGLWSLYSDDFAAGWLGFDPADDEEIDAFISWIESRSIIWTAEFADSRS